MSEAITSIEVNFSTNGGSHSASISTSDVESVCGNEGLGNVIGKLGSKSLFTNESLDKLLSTFVLDEETVTRDSFGTKKVKKYIDNLSYILDSWTLLTRGSACSPVDEGAGGYSYDGKIYPSSELTKQAFDDSIPEVYRKYTKNKTATSTYIDKDSRIVILGKTYSIISLTQEESTYLGLDKEKIYHVYHQGEFIERLSTGNKYYPPTHEKASIKYGYTSGDFFSALKSIGLNVTGASFDDINLFDISGTIRSCLSSIASFFGYYWYIDGNNIRFVNSSIANTIIIEDPTKSQDISIISASYTTGGRTPRLVCSFIGSSAPDKNPITSGGYTGMDSPATKKEFKNVDFDEIFSAQDTGLTKDDVGMFYYHFISKFSDSAEVFDSLVYSGKLSKLFSGGDSYNYELVKNDSKTLSEIVGANNLNSFKKESRGYGSEDNSIYYSLTTDSGEALPKPSSQDFYSILKTYFKTHGRVYISKGYGKKTASNYSFTGNNLTVSGPFESNKRIGDIPELAELAELFTKVGKTKPTVGALARAAGNSSIGDYYFIGMAPLSLDTETTKAMDFLKDVQCSFTYQDVQYLSLQNGVTSTQIVNFLKSSISAWSKAKNNYRKFVSVISIRANEKELTLGDGDIESNNPVYENAFYRVKAENVSKYSKSELKTFTGSVDDAKKLSNIFSSVYGTSYDLKSSSTTYYKFYIPETIDISIDSISITIGSDGVTSTISKSNKNYLPPDQSTFLVGSSSFSAPVISKLMKAGAKNFFGLH